MVDEIFRKIAHEIGQYYLAKAKGDYDLACTEILRSQITDIKVGMNLVVTICTNLPGRMIGIIGNNILELENHLKTTLGVTKLRIEENKDHILNWMLPNEHDDDYDPLHDMLDHEWERSERDKWEVFEDEPDIFSNENEILHDHEDVRAELYKGD